MQEPNWVVPVAVPPAEANVKLVLLLVKARVVATFLIAVLAGKNTSPLENAKVLSFTALAIAETGVTGGCVSLSSSPEHPDNVNAPARVISPTRLRMVFLVCRMLYPP
jgi:hypothetical protein